MKTTTSLLFSMAWSITLLAQVQIGEDIDGEAPYDNAGYSTSLSSDGTRVAVGSSGNDANGNGSGHVRVFEWNGVNWQQMGESIPGEAAFDGAGRGLSLSPDGERVAVGAYMNSAGQSFSEAGHVRVFEWNGTDWNQLGQDIDGKEFNDWTGLGESISIVGNRVAIGAPGNGSDFHRDYVRVFEWNDVEWVQLGNDIYGEDRGDRSGASVALTRDGQRLAIGGEYNDGMGHQAGHVRVFEWNGQEWNQMGQDIDGEAAGDGSGGSVSFSDEGNRLAIGARYNDGNGNRSGHVRIFEWNGSEWNQIGQDIDGRGPEAYSGRSVSLSSNGYTVAIGGCDNHVGRYNPGFVRMYKWNGTEWVQHGAEIKGEGNIDWSGHSVSLSSDGQVLAIGAHLNDGNGTDAGHVRIFDFSNVTSLAPINPGSVLISPNPTFGIIHFSGLEGAVNITVYDDLGRAVLEKANTYYSLDLSNLSSGKYTLHIKTHKNFLRMRVHKL